MPDHPLALRSDPCTRPWARAAGALLTALVGLGGCAADSSGATPIVAGTADGVARGIVRVIVRVIVRFAPEVADPTDPAFLAALAASARVGRIELIRPMSGDSYVMRIVCDDAAQPAAADACDAAIARVRASTAVRMIEPDGRETTR